MKETLLVRDAISCIISKGWVYLNPWLGPFQTGGVACFAGAPFCCIYKKWCKPLTVFRAPDQQLMARLTQNWPTPGTRRGALYIFLFLK